MKSFKPSLSALISPLLFRRGVEFELTNKIPIVMAHGIFDTGESFGALRVRLNQAGYKCLTPDLTPNTASAGMEPLAEQLANYIDENLEKDSQFHLLGYSMGGIVSRCYLAQLKNNNRCVSLTTLAAPHHGTQLAKAYPLKGGVELRPNSEFLNTLNNNPNSTHPNTLSIRTTLDGVIIPSKSSELPNTENLTFSTPSHPSLLISKRVAQSVLDHIKRSEHKQVNQLLDKEKSGTL